MARLVALLSWYREDPDWLHESVCSLTRVECDHVLAVDGAYGLFPGAKRRSSQEEHDVLKQAASDSGIALTIKTPRATWQSEVAKRSYMFRLAERFSEPHKDWWLVWDGDFFVQRDLDLKAALGKLDCDVAGATISEPIHDGPTTSFEMRLLFRATPGLRVEGNHFTYVAPDGRMFLGRSTDITPKVDAQLIDGLEIEHRTWLRDDARHKDSHAYYRIRNALGVELGPCFACDRQADREVPTDFQPASTGLYGKGGQAQLTATWVPACAEHAIVVQQHNAAAFQRLGVDSRTLECTYQNAV